MPLRIIRQDITNIECDAIVNAANESLLGGGGVDGAIHRAAGPELLEECRTLGGCRTGEAKLTGGYRLPCRYVIHTVGPVWHGGGCGEQELLESCYRSSLALAAEHHCESVAFPLISAGAYGYPKDRAIRVAVSVIGEFLMENDMLVYLVVFGKTDFAIGKKLFTDIESFIDDNYAAAHTDFSEERRRTQFYQASMPPAYDAAPPSGAYVPPPKAKGRRGVSLSGLWKRKKEEPASGAAAPAAPYAPQQAPRPAEIEAEPAVDAALPDLRDYVGQIDESFSTMLLRKIDERGMTDAQCYKKANIDRKLFSKIRNDEHYRPSKPTVLAFAIALELDLDETKDMLMKAGFTLSHSSRFDLIIEYFIRQGNYDVFEINEALFAFDQSILGG